MFFLFGPTMPDSLSEYFSDMAQCDGHTIISASMGEFRDSEPFAELLKAQVQGELGIIFQSVTRAAGFDAASNYVQMLAAADGLKRFGAKAVWGVNPLAGFMRQDKIKEGTQESLLSELSGRLMKTSGFDGISTVEAHSKEAIENYEIGLGQGNVLNINPNQAFVSGLERLKISVDGVGNPDGGSDARSENLSRLLGVGRFSMEKERNKLGSEITGHRGEVRNRTALIDDIAGTLKTAADGIELIYDQGSQNNALLISHPVMAGDAWDHLAKLLKANMIDHVLFLPTFSRNEEYNQFKKQYPDIADRVIFLEDEFNEMIYDHVVNEVANHPAMRLEA